MTDGMQTQVRQHLLPMSTRSAVLVLILIAAGYLRFEGLGVRSLWRDELCTWHVSRMGVWESLSWGPELTKPPLYQFALRLVTQDPHPSEAMLRFPAAVCGVLTILAGWWLGKIAAGRSAGLALAGLLAFNSLQIYYSQEARPYSMLMLGCTLSTIFWYRLVTQPSRKDFVAYVITVALTLHAHYLAALTVTAQVLWWVILLFIGHRSTPLSPPLARGEARPERFWRPLFAMVLIGVLCIPIVFRYLYFRSSMFQGLNWIKPPTWSSTLDVLEQLTFGWQWVFALFVPAIILWIVSAFGASFKWRNEKKSLCCGREDICGLLLVCFLEAWFGLLVISWIAHPAMVARYALPAAVGALAIPLIVAARIHRYAPVVLMIIFIIGGAPQWLARDHSPGLRELAAYLQEEVDPESEAVVLTIDATIYPGWEDSERLVFDYYPITGIPIEELHLQPNNVTAKNDILKDPRGSYLIVLWADAMKIVEAAGRDIIPFEIEGQSYDRLLFTPYRLVHVAPLSQDPS